MKDIEDVRRIGESRVIRAGKFRIVIYFLYKLMYV